MSDANDKSPPPEDTGMGGNERPSGTRGNNQAPALDSAEKVQRIVRGLEQAFAWLADHLPRKSGGETPLLSQAVLPALDRLAGIVTGLAAMLLVDHHYGPVGLGLFAWFVSLLAIAGYLGQYGIATFVENRMARAQAQADAEGLAADALAALLTLGLAAAGLSIVAAFQVAGPGWGAGDALLYLLLGPTILFQNINSLRLALLDGAGRHAQAAGLRIRQRFTLLVVLLVLCLAEAPVPFLAGAFPLSQLIMALMGRKRIQLPPVSAVLAGRKQIFRTIDHGRAFLFTGNSLDVVFYLDMLILGWFVGPVELGVYARAMILMRLFLVIPSGLRPVLRQRANRLVGSGDRQELVQLVARSSRVLFAVHGLLALFILVQFPRTMAFLFNLRQWTDQAFAVFALVLPGLVFHCLATALGPLFEADQENFKLKRLTLVVALVNLVLNLNLIPFAGIAGAALSTTVAMFVHFWLFCRWLPVDMKNIGIFWPGAAAALYLTYVPLAALNVGPLASLLLALLLFGTLLWSSGYVSPTKPVDRELIPTLPQGGIQ
ncbi:lipopolysaccharide biosynthesis protein [Desulfosarcina ovata]|uniref:Uncharacterized protein n=1 Tax=Desulfosarcina ovata subsp. ovata TaxID=2752305 RepID=A0A5K8AIV5_9BACT|nr:lipopolysaccharide biosynthesis protein [Desulfosarcina ovata]BBO92625.1 hypothetical protein DSCOOX_58050 [Desulfosarcina ovata subsp. ovata]